MCINVLYGKCDVSLNFLAFQNSNAKATLNMHSLTKYWMLAKFFFFFLFFFTFMYKD